MKQKNRPILCTDLSAKAKIYSVISLAFRGKDIAFSPDIFMVQMTSFCRQALKKAQDIQDADRSHIVVWLRQLFDYSTFSNIVAEFHHEYPNACVDVVPQDNRRPLEQLAQVGVDCSKVSPSFEGALIMIQMGTAMSIVPCLANAVIPGMVKIPLLDYPPVMVEIAAMRHAPRLEVQSFIKIAKRRYGRYAHNSSLSSPQL